MIDIQTFATLPAKACFVLLTDGQGLPKRMDPAMHLFPNPGSVNVVLRKTIIITAD
jgi:hypothetical protein